jgi:hypothetical protein
VYDVFVNRASIKPAHGSVKWVSISFANTFTDLQRTVDILSGSMTAFLYFPFFQVVGKWPANILKSLDICNKHYKIKFNKIM